MCRGAGGPVFRVAGRRGHGARIERQRSVIDDAHLWVEEVADTAADETLDACRVGLEEIEVSPAGGTVDTGLVHGVADGSARLELCFDEAPPARAGVRRDVTTWFSVPDPWLPRRALALIVRG